jgi:hypothetical protein
MFDFIKRAFQGSSDEELIQESDDFSGAYLDTYTVCGDVPNDVVERMEETNGELRRRGYRYHMVEQEWIKER